MLISCDNRVLSFVIGVDDFGFASSTVNVVACISVKFHTGHCVSRGNHGDPNFHNDDEASSCESIPHVRRSAGFGQ